MIDVLEKRLKKIWTIKIKELSLYTGELIDSETRNET